MVRPPSVFITKAAAADDKLVPVTVIIPDLQMKKKAAVKSNGHA
jgi:hypothetical protein